MNELTNRIINEWLGVNELTNALSNGLINE